SRWRTMPIMMSSETYWPAARIGWALRPSSVPAWISARSMSPVAMCGMPKWSRSMLAWVPLPLPGAPYRSKFTPLSLTLSPAGRGKTASFDEASVLAHHELRLQLLHRVERDADHEEDRGAAE